MNKLTNTHRFNVVH